MDKILWHPAIYKSAATPWACAVQMPMVVSDGVFPIVDDHGYVVGARYGDVELVYHLVDDWGTAVEQAKQRIK